MRKNSFTGLLIAMSVAGLVSCTRTKSTTHAQRTSTEQDNFNWESTVTKVPGNITGGYDPITMKQDGNLMLLSCSPAGIHKEVERVDAAIH